MRLVTARSDSSGDLGSASRIVRSFQDAKRNKERVGNWPSSNLPVRQSIVRKRERLHRLFPEKYAPDVNVFTDGKVEIMFSSRRAGGESCAADEGARSAIPQGWKHFRFEPSWVSNA
jgi:hypothetical protein